MGLGAFGVLTFKDGDNLPKTFDDLSGYAKRNPILAFLMTLFIFSLIGIPLTGGFIGKLQIFNAALEQGWIWLAIAGILNSALSVYYYLKVVMLMYMKEGATPQGYKHYGAPPSLALIGLILTALAVIYLGVFPNKVLELATLSVSSLM